ncbi:ubiquinol-cytochrome C chaperone family protein [Candidatus Odyssella thessalonicensis]|uniref:ubiquinol-cytochrome C chaperone family protein n=1 Tax=Candidatus Odyssella thessalonicensis TaxID=84647 RepID=UPI000225C077|nr:ubiquinol-cytochrome C chaperone family protein [Candidatus Odyssella thessalonicensis]
MFGKSPKINNYLAAVSLYQACVEKARDPRYYTDFSIEDQVLGRFEILSLQLFLMLRRLKEETSSVAKSLSQEICNLFVADMDHSLRNVRLSEKKIDKSFKRFIEGFYGRLVAYDEGLEEGSLDKAILKNIYDNNLAYQEIAKNLAEEATGLLNILRQQSNVNNLKFTGGMDGARI